MTTQAADVQVESHGSLVLFTPESDDAQEWLEGHTDGMWWGRSLVVEPRYAHDLAYGLREEGYNVA